MILRMPTHCFDDTCPSCVAAGDFVFLAHHAGGFEQNDIAYQMRAVFERVKGTLESVGATLNDLVQVDLYLRDLKDFEGAIGVFREYFDSDSFPARMTSTTDFLDAECLCMLKGIAYRPQNNR